MFGSSSVFLRTDVKKSMTRVDTLDVIYMVHFQQIIKLTFCQREMMIMFAIMMNHSLSRNKNDIPGLGAPPWACNVSITWFVTFHFTVVLAVRLLHKCDWNILEKIEILSTLHFENF